jgi:hypothetical protein
VDFGFRVPPVGPTLEPGIVYWFRPTTVPVGGAPLHIRQRWIGVPLPVRRPRPVEGPESYVGRDVADRRIERQISDGVRVALDDAIAALRYFGEEDAADWWEDLIRRRPMTTALVFRRGEGELMPPRLAHLLHPELQDFGNMLLD